MTGYRLPAGTAETSFVEKRSTFIGHVWPVKTEEEARAHVDEMKKKYHDARHNCWCYLIQDRVIRYSDDGEPQGTAGQPMLSVFQKENVTDVCCVVTRYFGGILLGTGGLVRAYTQSAKDTLKKSGIAVMCRRIEVAVSGPYRYLDRMKQECAAFGGVVAEVEYAAEVTAHIFLPEEEILNFTARMSDLSSGELQIVQTGEKDLAVPLNP